MFQRYWETTQTRFWSVKMLPSIEHEQEIIRKRYICVLRLWSTDYRALEGVKHPIHCSYLPPNSVNCTFIFPFFVELFLQSFFLVVVERRGRCYAVLSNADSSKRSIWPMGSERVQPFHRNPGNNSYEVLQNSQIFKSWVSPLNTV